MIILDRFPLAPTSNNLYVNSARGGRKKSTEAILYSRDCRNWALENNAEVRLAKKAMAQWPKTYEIKTFFVLKRERIFCQDGSVKRLDATNLIKATHDMLAEILSVDDRTFFRALCEKVEMIQSKFEYCIAVLMPAEPRNEIKVRENLAALLLKAQPAHV